MDSKELQKLREKAVGQALEYCKYCVHQQASPKVFKEVYTEILQFYLNEKQTNNE